MGLLRRFRGLGIYFQNQIGFLSGRRRKVTLTSSRRRIGHGFGFGSSAGASGNLLSLIIASAILITLLIIESGHGLVFKNGLPEYMDGFQARSLIGAGGVILDIPKIRVLRYKVRNSDPHIVSDELNCENGECGEIVEPPLSKLHLGTNSAKEANEWSIPPNVTQLVIECKSRSGVVEWEYEGNGVMSEIEIENSRVVGDFWSPSTYLHISLLTLNKISDQLTGKYTCKNMDKTSKSNSFYLFVPQPKSEVINDGRKLEVMPPSHADEVVIPCRMEKRQSPIYLFRKGSDGIDRKVPLRGRMRFDPYLGFVLPVTPDVFGDYVCKVEKKRKKKNKREVVTIITPEPKSNPRPSIPTIPLSQAQPKSSAPLASKSIPISTKKPSPGFSAFPNSIELSDIIQTEEDAVFLKSLLGDEHSTLPPEMVLPPVPATTVGPNLTDVQEVASFQPYKQRKNRLHGRRRRKRPYHLRRHNGVDITSGILSRRGGPFLGPPIHPQRAAYLKLRPRPVYHSPHHLRPHLDSQSSPMPTPHHFYGNNRHRPFYKSHYYGHTIPSPGIAHPRLPPGAGTVAGVLPTYSGSSNLASHEGFEKTPGSSESSSGVLGLGPGEKFIAETLMSRVDGTGTNKFPMRSPMHSHPPPPSKKPISLFPQNLLPPTETLVHTMQCVLKKMVLGADAPCNASLTEGIAIAERHGNSPNKKNDGINAVGESSPVTKDYKTILEVTILPPPENKFFPVQSAIFTTTPFFVKWETRFTDYANWAETNHTIKNGAFKRHRAEIMADFENGINALEVFDIPEGEKGNITVTYMGGKKEIKTHTWHYLIINSTTFNNKGLKQTVDGVVKVFMCRSATSKRPILSLSRLTENGCPEINKDPFAGAQDYTEEDCGTGCTLIRTKIEQGIVKCVGDGVDQTLMFPEESQCTGRPYFISRGQTKNLTLTAKGNRLLIPCIINNPNADVYLFHEEKGVMNEVTDNSTYDLKVGFYFDTSTVKDPYGTYVCTSTPDLDDETDMVRYHVTPMEDYVFYPPHETVFGSPPFKFMWESTDELEVVNASIGKFDTGMFAKADGSRPHVGTFEIYSNLTEKEGTVGEVKIVRKSDKKLVHVWHFKHIRSVGLSLDKDKNLFRCQAGTENQPILYAVPCDNPNVCKLERKHFDEEDEDIQSGRENSHCGDGCVQLKIWRNRPLGFVRCKGDGVDEALQYFLTENSTILTEEDKPSLEQLKTPEILNGVRRLRVGETADFICKANRYFYSKGFQWAIETRNGQKKFIDAKVRDDVIVKDEIRSVINLKVLDSEWKSVWCYTPELLSNQWANISQPLYLR